MNEKQAAGPYRVGAEIDLVVAFSLLHQQDLVEVVPVVGKVAVPAGIDGERN